MIPFLWDRLGVYVGRARQSKSQPGEAAVLSEPHVNVEPSPSWCFTRRLFVQAQFGLEGATANGLWSKLATPVARP